LVEGILMPQLNGGSFLASLMSRDPDNGLLIKQIISAVNALGRTLGADPVGRTESPTPINTINVKGNLTDGIINCPGELLHFTLQHNGETTIGTHYFAEIATESSFLQPHVIDMGASRTHTMTLPTYLDNGSTKQSYYIRAYAQGRGSLPNKPTVLGGLDGATEINMSGSTAATLLPSTGSGTAPSNGTKGNSGLGKTLTGTAAVVPKRSVASQ
jgi:hypothetical protein